jgi:hypothetical protein
MSNDNIQTVNRIQYRYITFPVDDIEALFRHPREPDAYTATGPLEEAVFQAIVRGYRWIRTDGATAIFEARLEHAFTEYVTDKPAYIEKMRANLFNPLEKPTEK